MPDFINYRFAMVDFADNIGGSVMEPANHPPFWRSALFKIGVLLLLLSVSSWLALIITTAHEQAQTPGEKSLGVAVLGLIWGLPMLAFGAGGIAVLLVHSVLFLYRRFHPS
jgi:ABC-type amino acid transport system permease subunit